MKVDNSDTSIIKIKKILSEYYGLDRFQFEKYFTFFRIDYKIIFLPHLYYFIFTKKNNELFCKFSFPNWSNDNLSNKNLSEFDKDLINWLKSIKKTQIRKNKINVSIKEGAKKRKEFNEIVKKI